MGYIRKLWLLVIFSGCILMLQYNLSSWNQNPHSSLKMPSQLQQDTMLLSAVSRLQLDSSVVQTIGEEYLRNLAYQIARELQYSGCDSLSSSSHGTSSTVPNSETIYVITPTYRRPEQLPELTRLAQTLMNIPNLIWLVIEDANSTSNIIEELLKRSSIPYHHLAAPMPEQHKAKKVKPRGVANRIRGLKWLRANATKGGVFYFADDDNTYDVRLFDEIRTTKKVSMFPVGLCTKLGVSSPIVVNGTFTGFYDGWVGGRKFAVDMAGFAVNVNFLLERPKATMPYRAGFEEEGFLRSLAPFEPSEIELKADNCTKILVWHTQTKKNEPSAPLNLALYNNTNIVHLKSILV